MSLSKTHHPDCSWRAGCRLAWSTPPSCVNVCMKGWMLGNIVKRFEWPLVRKALVRKCSLFTIFRTALQISWTKHETGKWDKNESCLLFLANHTQRLHGLFLVRLWFGFSTITSFCLQHQQNYYRSQQQKYADCVRTIDNDFLGWRKGYKKS